MRFLAWFLLVLTAAPALASPDALADRFVEALNAGDSKKLKVCCTEAFWASEPDMAPELLEESQHREFTFRKAQVRTQGKRSVALIDVLREGKPVDRLYLYGEEEGGGWQFAFLDENERHVLPFLAGKAPARLVPEDFTQDSSLKKTVTPLLQAFPSWKEKMPPMEDRLAACGLQGDEWGRRMLLEDLTGYADLTLVGAYRPEWSEVGLVKLEGKAAEYDYTDTKYLHFEQTEDGWRLLQVTSISPAWELLFERPGK